MIKLAAIACVAAMTLIGTAQAQVLLGQSFPLVTAGLTAQLLSVEVHHVSADNTIEVAVVLRPSKSAPDADYIVASAEFCMRYGQDVMATIRAEGTQTRVYVFAPLFMAAGTLTQTSYAFPGETCSLETSFPVNLRAVARQNASALLPN